jgi:hypothetical protein
VCEPSYSGADCSTRYCPYDCYGNGACSNGVCACTAPFVAPYCSDTGSNGFANQSSVHGVFKFEHDVYRGDEGDSVTVRVLRTVGFEGAVGVRVSTRDVTAFDQADYTGLYGEELRWLSGDEHAQEVHIALLQDFLEESDESFEVFLTPMRGGAMLAVNGGNVTTVIINANSGGNGNFATDSDVVQVALRLHDVPLATIPENTAARQLFVEAYARDISAALSLPSPQYVQVVAVEGATPDALRYIKVTIRLLHDDSLGRSSVELARDLVEQVARPASALYSGDVTQNVDATFAPEVLISEEQRDSDGKKTNPLNTVLILIICGMALLLVCCVTISYVKRKQIGDWLLWKFGNMRFSAFKANKHRIAHETRNDDEKDGGGVGDGDGGGDTPLSLELTNLNEQHQQQQHMLQVSVVDDDDDDDTAATGHQRFDEMPLSDDDDDVDVAVDLTQVDDADAATDVDGGSSTKYPTNYKY